MNWFGQSFRKVLIVYVSPQWAKGRGEAFDAEVYADSLAEAGVDCVELCIKDHHGICYFPCSLGLPYPRNILGELLPELRKRDIRLMAYVSICFDNYALGLHPQWRAVNSLGDPCKIGPFYMACWSSPYMDFVLQQICELAEGYDVDGYWLDIMPLARQVPQAVWMTNDLPVPCYCLSCQQAYQRETGEPLPLNPSEAQADQAYQFLLGKGEAFVNRAIMVIHEFHPDALITYNGDGAPGDPVMLGDLVSIEGHAPLYTRQSFIARWGKASGKPFEILTAGGLFRQELGGGWNSFDQKPPVILQLESALAVSHGGSTVIGIAPYPDGCTDPAQFQGLGKVFQRIRNQEPWLREPEGIADVGLALLAKPRTAPSLWYHMTGGAESIHEALLDGHYQYNLLPTLDEIDRHQVLILADQAALSDVELEQVRGYVRRGGRLLASGTTSLYDEGGRRRSDFGLSDVFGVSLHQDPQLPFTYIRLHPGPLAERVTALPIFSDEGPLEVSLNGASVLADLVYPEATFTDATTVLWGPPGPDKTRVHPGLCVHQYGKGSCWYAAWHLRSRNLTNSWIKRLIAALVEDMVGDPLLRTSAPPGVEVVLNRQADRYVVHLVNTHAGTPDRLSLLGQPHTLTGLTVELNLTRLGITAVQRVYTPADASLPYQETDDWLAIRVPPLHVHEILVIE
jgi:hypothetical protein